MGDPADDLDDLLDEFGEDELEKEFESLIVDGAAGTGAGAGTATAETKRSGVEAVASTADSLVDNEFAKQLELGMSDLLKDVEANPELKKQFEELSREMQQLTDGDIEGFSRSKAASATGAKDGKQSLQDTVARTVERMKDSAKSPNSDNDADGFLQELLAQLEGDSASEDGLSGMLQTMMQQLTQKEILYEPMKELYDKYPGWLAQNRDKLSADDTVRYERQLEIVTAIVQRFEAPTYSDSNEEDKKYISDKMSQMQDSGSPPSEIMGSMPGGLDLDSDGIPKLPKDLEENCPVQ
ncbi:hypothetical protein CANCADRAFT_24304 [Tortispora caseinolytica NRRL Y-17796]|uniref:Pex19 protein n=1 Tax=Tortispora caseinolytica NRRL Y-17796 TaxID=767744 RepID=A0A1E4THX1_9ASCO|nr:hypothetical protein CANCADRAFT_24304 [Tortispora caseinolytica NRRL Y-17796]